MNRDLRPLPAFVRTRRSRLVQAYDYIFLGPIKCGFVRLSAQTDDQSSRKLEMAASRPHAHTEHIDRV